MQREQGAMVEDADPREQYRRVRRVVSGLALGLVAWAAAYAAIDRPDVATAFADRRISAAASAAGGATEQGAIDGRKLYAANCQACHRENGQGVPGVFPPLAGASWVTGDPQVLAQIVLRGMVGPIEVLGTTYDGAMPGYGGQLGDAELAAISSFIRSQWGNGSSAVDARTLAAARSASAGQSQPWQGAEELQRRVPGNRALRSAR